MSTIDQVSLTPAGKQPARPARPASAEPTPAAPQDSVTLAEQRSRIEAAEKILDSNTVAAMMGKKLDSGETIQISTDGKVLLEVKKQGVSTFDKVKSMAGQAFQVSAAEVSNIVGQDPAFAFKESALAVKDQVFNGIPGDYATLAEKGFLPMIRVVALALDGKKAVETWKNPDSKPLDKVVDTAHVATDMVGLGGAVAMAIPSVGPAIANTMTVVGLCGDIGAYGYHVMKYFGERGLPIDGGGGEDPNQPTDPTDPSQPTDPSYPSDPSQPSDPNYPSDPSQPPQIATTKVQSARFVTNARI